MVSKDRNAWEKVLKGTELEFIDPFSYLLSFISLLTVFLFPFCAFYNRL